ncbi:MAG TPA: NAD-dependent deacylase [Solirubrobacteraceae bacterium]|nr:NAD-dependent deacylase [Solirubrobacteraceae bacterium]
MDLEPTRPERLARLVREAGSVVALTGAGVSVPSGIPDFRSPGTGLWQKVDPMEVAHIDAFLSDPARFWEFYAERFATLRDREPNRAHGALAELERRGHLDAVITQNVDMLHRKAGTQTLIEVHGSIEHSDCLACEEQFGLDEVAGRREVDPQRVPRCDCGEPLKPGVVLFGELLPAAALARAQELAERADLLLCVGSSLEVYPVAQLPFITRASGGRVALVTRSPTPADQLAEVKLDGDVVDELDALLAAL